MELLVGLSTNNLKANTLQERDDEGVDTEYYKCQGNPVDAGTPELSCRRFKYTGVGFTQEPGEDGEDNSVPSGKYNAK
jgi:hypothetical protein